MLTLTENIGGVRQPVSARLMSDGTLRFLAIVSALLDPVNPARSDSPHNRLMAVEELENGLHPSQAELLLRFLKESANQRGVRTIATTHSPAILDALQGSDHSDVVVCTRDSEGWTTVTRLTDFPDYFEIVGRHSLGTSAIRDDIRSHGTTPVASPTLDLIFGR